MSRWQWLMSRLGKQLWVRTSAIGVMGILIAVLSAVIEPYLPWELSGEVSREAVDSLLSILASSMLAVTTFSLSIMVSAYGSATKTSRQTYILVFEEPIAEGLVHYQKFQEGKLPERKLLIYEKGNIT